VLEYENLAFIANKPSNNYIFAGVFKNDNVDMSFYEPSSFHRLHAVGIMDLGDNQFGFCGMKGD
jgi:hypothetical protein